MTYALVAHTSASSPNQNTFTSSPLSTLGADLLVLCLTDGNNVGSSTISDSQGNVWTQIDIATNANNTGRLFYAWNALTSAAHTFTVTGTGMFGTLMIAAFSGSMRSGNPLDTQNNNGGTNGGGPTAQPGSITPSTQGGLIVTGISQGLTGTFTVDSGFTITDQTQTAGGAHWGGGMAFLIQGSNNPVNPMWTCSQQGNMSAEIAAFRNSNASIPVSVGSTPTDFPALTGDYGDYSVFNYSHVGATIGSSTAIKSQAALLHTVTVNFAATAGVLTLTDGNGGPTIATVDMTKQVPYLYDLKANNGLWVSTTTVTGTTPSVTIAYA